MFMKDAAFLEQLQQEIFRNAAQTRAYFDRGGEGA